MSDDNKSTTKRCSRCREDLPLTEFHRDRRLRDGLRVDCKACCAAASKRRYWKDPERHRALVKERRKAKRKQYNASARQRYYENHEAEKQRYRDRYARDPDAARQRARSWYAENKSRLRKLDRAKRRRADPEKIRAREAVAIALRAGRLKKAPCEICGAKPAHAHHDDYSQPLDVRWLCPQHHADWHRAQREAGLE